MQDGDSFSKKVPYLIFGGISVAVGISIYFFMPLAVLNFDLGLLLEILFLLLLGMIFGLALIAINF